MDDLFLAVMERFLDLLHAAARPPADENASGAGDAYRRRLERLRGVTSDAASVFLAETSLYAIRHPQVAEQVATMHQAQLEPAKAFVRSTLRRLGIAKPKVSVDKLANIAQCLTFSLHLFGQLDSKVAPEKTLAAAMEMIYKGLAAG